MMAEVEIVPLVVTLVKTILAVIVVFIIVIEMSPSASEIVPLIVALVEMILAIIPPVRVLFPFAAPAVVVPLAIPVIMCDAPLIGDDKHLAVISSLRLDREEEPFRILHDPVVVVIDMP